MGRRVLKIVLLIASALVTVAIFAVAPNPVHNLLAYGTFDTTGAPPRVDYCGRRYYPGNATLTTPQVQAQLAQNGLHDLTRIGTAPTGMPIVAAVNSPAVRAQYHTDVCAMVVYVQTGR